VDDRVDTLGGEDLGHHRGTDVGSDEADVTEVAARRHDVDPDDGVDLRVGGDPPREPTPYVAAHARDEHDTTHGRLPAYLPWRRRWMRVFFNSLRCFFFAIRLRRFLITEPTVCLSGVYFG
jgi:hypothetical protein